MSDVAAPLDRVSSEAGVIAVVLNYNRPDDTIECVRSLLGLDGVQCDVAVIDNGSTDDSVEAIHTAHPDIPILETGSNLGFGGGMNVGIRWALSREPSFVWLLNNDTLVDPRALSSLLVVAERDPSIGIVGSVIVEMDDPTTVQTWGGGRVNLWLGSTTRYTRESNGPLDHIIGVSMFVRRQLFEDVPGFSSCYRFYLEDTDFSCEARRRGWRLAVASGSIVRHRLGATIGAGHGIRPLTADLLFARGVGTLIARQSGLRIVIAAPLRLAAIVATRARRRQLDRVPRLIGAFAAGIACGMRRSIKPNEFNQNLASQ